jgi:hypothetical protein
MFWSVQAVNKGIDPMNYAKVWKEQKYGPGSQWGLKRVIALAWASRNSLDWTVTSQKSRHP